MTPYREHSNVTRLFAPDDWCAEHLQVEEPTGGLYTGDEITFAFFVGGALGCFVTVALAFVWAEFL